ncbi:hypothetical protein GCM10009800_31490 [Nocardiopsis rhodophaea]
MIIADRGADSAFPPVGPPGPTRWAEGSPHPLPPSLLLFTQEHRKGTTPIRPPSRPQPPHLVPPAETTGRRIPGSRALGPRIGADHLRGFGMAGSAVSRIARPPETADRAA